mgnify:CR=1 FL=1
MANLPWKKKKGNSDFGFFFDFSNIDKLFNEMLRDFESLDEMPKKPMVMGFNLKIGPDGRPTIQHFGNIRPEQGKPVIADAREPLVDVTKTDKDITITAELPGVEKKDIDIEPGKKSVEIKVAGERPFYKKLELETAIKPKTAKAKFKNGILEVTFEREKKGVKIH